MKEPAIEELLLIISEKDNDEREAKNAFVTLYHRFGKFLNSAVIGHLKAKGVYNKDFADDIVANVFLEVYENPLRFSFDPKKHQNDDTAFKAWISTIARNEFADMMTAYLKHSKINVLSSDGELDDTAIKLEIEEEFLSNNRKLIDKALEGLTDRERHILLSCYDFYEDGKNTPSVVLDSLCEYWGTTRANVRQVKKRALDKVITYMNSSVNIKKK